MGGGRDRVVGLAAPRFKQKTSSGLTFVEQTMGEANNHSKCRCCKQRQSCSVKRRATAAGQAIVWFDGAGNGEAAGFIAKADSKRRGHGACHEEGKVGLTCLAGPRLPLALCDKLRSSPLRKNLAPRLLACPPPQPHRRRPSNRNISTMPPDPKDAPFPTKQLIIIGACGSAA